jgi:hypothetical protein
MNAHFKTFKEELLTGVKHLGNKKAVSFGENEEEKEKS